MRAVHPRQVIVKIAQAGETESLFCSRITDSVPANVLGAVRDVLLVAGPHAGNGFAVSSPSEY